MHQDLFLGLKIQEVPTCAPGNACRNAWREDACLVVEFWKLLVVMTPKSLSAGRVISWWSWGRQHPLFDGLSVYSFFYGAGNVSAQLIFQGAVHANILLQGEVGVCVCFCVEYSNCFIITDQSQRTKSCDIYAALWGGKTFVTLILQNRNYSAE